MTNVILLSWSIIILLRSYVNAHGYVAEIETNGGVRQSGYRPAYQYQQPSPQLAAWSVPKNFDNGFISNYSNPDIICHLEATPGQTYLSVDAGSTVTMKWTPWPAGHLGPIINYLAKCTGECTSADKENLLFNKIDETGLVATGSPSLWAVDELVASNNTWNVTIPKNIAPGKYVLRHEIISLHDAGAQGHAQHYPQCFNLEISGNGTESLSNGTVGTQLYGPEDPGLRVDIYAPLVNYTLPGPAVVRMDALSPVTMEDSLNSTTNSTLSQTKITGACSMAVSRTAGATLVFESATITSTAMVQSSIAHCGATELTGVSVVAGPRVSNVSSRIGMTKNNTATTPIRSSVDIESDRSDDTGSMLPHPTIFRVATELEGNLSQGLSVLVSATTHRATTSSMFQPASTTLSVEINEEVVNWSSFRTDRTVSDAVSEDRTVNLATQPNSKTSSHPFKTLSGTATSQGVDADESILGTLTGLIVVEVATTPVPLESYQPTASSADFLNLTVTPPFHPVAYSTIHPANRSHATITTRIGTNLVLLTAADSTASSSAYRTSQVGWAGSLNTTMTTIVRTTEALRPATVTEVDGVTRSTPCASKLPSMPTDCDTTAQVATKQGGLGYDLGRKSRRSARG